MRKICDRRLVRAEVKYKILTLATMYRNEFPKPKSYITIVAENGFRGRGKMNVGGKTRIDSLGWWYRIHSNIAMGTIVGVYKDDNGNYMLKLEDNAGREGVIEDISEPENDGYEEDVTSRTLEKNIEDYLINKGLDILEDGLTLVGQQHIIDSAGDRLKIDILAKDNAGNLVVIELKAGIAKKEVCGQILEYIALARKIPDAKEVRGIIIAHEFDNGLRRAVSNLPYVSLKKYNMKFDFEDIAT